MSIEETEYGTYRARWRIPGQANPRSRTFKRRADAERHLRRVLTDIERGVYVLPGSSRATVAETADAWLAASRKLARSTTETYRRDLDRYILPEIGAKKLNRLTAEDIDTFIEGRLKEGAAVSSVRRERATVSRLCSWAVSRGRLVQNPVERTEAPPATPQEMHFLRADEVDAIADRIAPRYRALILVGAWGGLRWSEMVGLRPSDVRRDTIHVRSQLLRAADKSWYRTDPKSRASKRRVGLPSSIAADLTGHLEEWAAEGPQGPLVFPNQNGSPIIASSWHSSHWAKALRRACVDPATRPHDLRHTAVALAIAAGAHPKTIQARMGHSSISVTLDRYGHLFPDLADTLAADLDRLRVAGVRVPMP